MKYIVHKGNRCLEEIDIFCETSSISHSVRAEKLGILDNVISAGFLKFEEDGSVHCGGFSNSLSDKLGRAVTSRGAADEQVFKIHNTISKRW
ncbi:MAG: hypothetical protein OEZ01_07450 [Candidatus Heimdallarchaeota archaeon]|nr:hypothetical protein [Candidatus Heimdallarchaeota archaeon]